MPPQFTQRKDKDIYEMAKDSPIPNSRDGKRLHEEEPSDEEQTNHKRSRVDRSKESSVEGSAEESPEASEFEDHEEGEILDSDNYESDNKRRGHKTSALRQTRKPKPTSNENTRQKKRPRKPKPKSAARVERSSSRSDSEERNDVEADLDIPDQESNFQPRIVYNEHWSKAQEKRLRRAWSEDDDFLIEKSYEDEKALWRKTTKLFKRAAPDLIEADMGVAPGRAISNPLTKKKWEKNPNWSQKFCNGMGAIVCLPYWRQRPEFLQYILRKALHLRVGSDDPRAPKLLPTPNISVDPLLDEIEEEIRDAGIVEEDNLPLLREIIERKVSREKTPEHWKFQEYLKDVVKKGERVTEKEDSCKLQVCNLDNIQAAWDTYNKKNKLQLPTMVQYREEYMAANSNKGFVMVSNTQSRQEDFKSWKKEWMLRVRRDAKIKKSVREARGRSMGNNQDHNSQPEENVDGSGFDNNDAFDNSGPFENDTSLSPQPSLRSQRGTASTRANSRQGPGAAATSPAESQRDAALHGVSPSRYSLVPETQLEQERDKNKKAASPSKNDAPFGHLNQGLAGMNLNQGSASQSYSGAAREGAKLPDTEDEMAAQERLIEERLAADERRMGAFNFKKYMERQASKSVIGIAELEQMDASLRLIDPRPKGKSTYMITLPYSKKVKDAIWGHNESFFKIKEQWTVNIVFKHEGNQFLIYAETDRCDRRLIDNPEHLKRLLVLAHGGLKFWKWLIEEVEDNMEDEVEFFTELNEGLGKWQNTEDLDVAHYFLYVLKKDDDRFHGLHDDAPKQQSSVNPTLKTTYVEESKAGSSADPTPEITNVEKSKANDKAGQEEKIFLPDGSEFDPNEAGNAYNPLHSRCTAGSNKPREKKGHAAQSNKGQANASSPEPESKKTKGKGKEKATFFQALNPDDQMPGEDLPRGKYIPLDDDNFSAFDPIGRAKKAAKGKKA